MEESSTEKATAEEESTEAKATYTTPRYEKAYEIPKEQLKEKDGHHQVFIEPITEGSGIIKGHTSVKVKLLYLLIINLLTLRQMLMVVQIKKKRNLDQKESGCLLMTKDTLILTSNETFR